MLYHCLALASLPNSLQVAASLRRLPGWANLRTPDMAQATPHAATSVVQRASAAVSACRCRLNMSQGVDRERFGRRNERATDLDERCDSGPLDRTPTLAAPRAPATCRRRRRPYIAATGRSRGAECRLPMATHVARRQMQERTASRANFSRTHEAVRFAALLSGIQQGPVACGLHCRMSVPKCPGHESSWVHIS